MSIEFAEQQPAEPAFELRPGQPEIVDALRQSRQDGIKSGYINVATGMGKTVVIAHDITDFRTENPDARILYLCHNADILRQARETLGPIVGTESQGNVFGGEFEDQEDIVYATFQTMNRRLEKGKTYEAFDPQEFDYVVVDESHHGPAETYSNVIDYFQPEVKRGLTSTPKRRDQKDIKGLFHEEIYTLQLEEAIAEGYLARPDYHVLTDHVRKLGELETDLGKIKINQLNREVFVPKRDAEIARTIEAYIGKIENPRTLIFCSSIDHAEKFSELAPGRAAAWHSQLSPEDQQEILRQFKAGELDTLLAVDKMNEGVDIPEVNAVIFLRSTESRTVFLQQLGRGLRKIPGKEEVLVLDFVASWERIKDVQSVHHNISQLFNQRPDVQSAKTPFSFNFSQEVFEAIEVIEFARNSQKKPKPKEVIKTGLTRREKWDQEEQEIMTMLGISELPQQKITRQEWDKFTRRLVLGDESVKEEIVMRSLRTAYGLAKRFAEYLDSNELTLEEHFHHAIEAIIDSFNSFDQDKHILRDHIGLSIYTTLNTKAKSRSLIRLPQHVNASCTKIEKAKEKLEKRFGREALISEIAEDTGFSQEDIEKLYVVKATMDYEVLGSDDDIEGVPSNDEDLDDIAYRDIKGRDLRNLLEQLPPREREVINGRYGLTGKRPQTLDEVGRVFNVARERIRQIEIAALKKMQSLPEAQPLLDSSPDPGPIVVSNDYREIRLATHLGYRAYFRSGSNVHEQRRGLAKELGLGYLPTIKSLQQILADERSRRLNK